MAKTSINYDKLVAARTSLKSIKTAIKRSDFFAGNFKKKETVIKNNLLKYDLISVLRKKCVYRISPDILHGSGGIGVFDDHTLLDIEGSSNNSLDFVNETESSREDNGYLITYINAPVKEYWSKISEECESQSDFNLAPLVDDKPYNKLNSYLKEYTENVNKLYDSYANIKIALNVVCDDIDKAIRKINKIINAYMSLEKQSKKKFGDRSATRVQKQLTTLLKSGVSAKKIKSIAKELGYNVIISGKTVSIIRRRINSSKNTNATQVSKKTKSKLSAVATLKKDLKKALKEGKKKKPFGIYKSLVSVIGVDKAKKYLNNLGYKVGKNDDGSKVIKKIKSKDDSKNKDNSSKDSDDGSDSKDSDNSENSSDSEQSDKSDEPENNNDSDGSDEPTNDDLDNSSEPINEDSNNSDEPTNDDQSNGQPTNDSVATPSDDNASDNTSTSTYDSSNDSSSSGSSYNYSSDVDSGSGNDSSGDGLIFDDSTSDEGVTDVDASKLVPSDNGDDSIIDDSVVSTPTKRVKTLEDDSTTSSSKSSGKSGLSAAVPLGLGVVATGAAAVAGARYIKHRKDSSYEDENYDDENNNLDEGNDYSYTDNSSNYDDSYMSDDYLGPAGSSYTDTNLDETSDDSDNVSDGYIDSDEYEDDSNDEDDLVLKDLN